MSRMQAAFNSSLITHHSSLDHSCLLFLLSAGDDLLGLFERCLKTVAVAVLEFGKRLRGYDRAANPLKRELYAVRHLRARLNLRQVDAGLHHRLRDGGAYARQY